MRLPRLGHSLVLLALSACNTPPHDPGILVLLAESPPDSKSITGIEFADVHVTGVEAVLRSDPADSSSESIVDLRVDPKSLDLEGLDRGTPRVLGLYYIPPGSLQQLRFIVDYGAIGVDGVTMPAKLPSFPETGLKILPSEPVRISDGRYSYLKVEFDPAKQIENPPGQGYLFNPVIPAQEELNPNGVGSFVPDEISVFLDHASDASEVDAVLAQFGGVERRNVGLDVVYQFPPGTDLVRPLTVLNSAAMKDFVQVAIQNEIGTIEGTASPVQYPSDPFYNSQWDLPKISALNAWHYSLGTSKAVVAVLDCGIWYVESGTTRISGRIY